METAAALRQDHMQVTFPPKKIQKEKKCTGAQSVVVGEELRLADLDPSPL